MIRFRQLCSCRLPNYAYYKRRCPKCGLYRIPGTEPAFRTRQEYNRYVLQKKFYTKNKKSSQFTLLNQLRAYVKSRSLHFPKLTGQQEK
jgi:uncharacterized C2H2 Zn-finger protein